MEPNTMKFPQEQRIVWNYRNKHEKLLILLAAPFVFVSSRQNSLPAEKHRRDQPIIYVII